jgi:hypothetical protein
LAWRRIPVFEKIAASWLRAVVSLIAELLRHDLQGIT